MEQIIETALRDADIPFVTDFGGGETRNLDFYLPEQGVYIEVKRMHSPRIAEQMSRAQNVIAAQGDIAVRFLADAIRARGVAAFESG